MRYFFVVVCFVVVHYASAQQVNFDFDKAWEWLYRAELESLPKTASQKADSIYQAAVRLEKPAQRIKALIYQAKFLLLLDEEAHSPVVARFEEEIEQASAPYRNILQNRLARLYYDIYMNNHWKIRQRTQLVDTTSNLETWTKDQYLEKIKNLFLNSLELEPEHVHAPISDFEALLDPITNNRKFRPLLIDLLAQNAIFFFKERESERTRPTEAFFMKDDVLMGQADEFSDLILEDADSGSFYLQALKVYQKLTRIHQEDQDQWALTDLTIARLKFVKDEGAILKTQALYRQALLDLREGLASDSAAAMADLERARYEKERGDLYDARSRRQDQYRKRDAVAICDSIIRQHPGTAFAKEASSLKAIIVHPSLDLTIEAFNLPNEPSKMLATYSNYDRLHFRSYHISPEQFDEFRLLHKDSARNAFINRLSAVKDWQAKLKNEHDYQIHYQEVLFPAHELGAYLVIAYASEERSKLLAFGGVQVTRLGIVRVHRPYHHEYRVFDRQTGASVPGAKVRFYSHRSVQRNRINRQFTTDSRGMISFSNNDWYSNVHVRLSKGEDSIRLDSHFMSEDREPEKQDDGYTVMASLFTDRAIYRPGQELYFKAILFKQTKKASEVAPGQTLTLTLYDPNGQDIWYDHYTTNEFGSITGTVKLPKTGLTGVYYFALEAEDEENKLFDDADNGLDARHSFRIEEYKRPKFEVTFPAITEIYQFNDSVHIKGQANALAGPKVTGAKVVYQVSRSLQHIGFRYFDYGRYSQPPATLAHGELTTDEEGEFEVPFKALINPKDTLDLISVSYTIEVTVTDINGESRSNSTTVKVSDNPYLIDLATADRHDKGEDTLSISVVINSLNGAKQAIGGKLLIQKLKAPDHVKRTAPWSMPDYEGFTKAEHDSLFPHWPYKNEAHKYDWPVLANYHEEDFAPGSENSMKVGGTQNWPSGYYRATFNAKSELGDSLVASKIFLLREAQPRQLPDKALFEAWLDKSNYEPGDTAILTFGTAAREMTAQLTIARKAGVEHHIVKLENELKQLQIPVLEGDEEGLSVYTYSVLYNEIRTNTVDVAVNRKWPRLLLETGTFRNKLQPGIPEQWTFKVKGESGEAASAELLASMYDASLDQFSSNNWRFSPFYQPYYRSYNRVDGMGSFNTIGFRDLVYEPYYEPSNRTYDRWNWFGLSVSRPESAHNEYLTRLRYLRNVRPVIGSEKRSLPAGVIEGRVFDEAGSPLAYATVFIAGTTNGDVTDEKGRFHLNASQGQDIHITFIGYKTFQFSIEKDNYYELQLLPDDADVGEIVVVGYGSQERKFIEYELAVEIPDSEEIEEEVALEMNFGEGAFYVADSAGDTASVLRSRAPGAGFSIKLRGNSTFEGPGSPLVIVDGVLMTDLTQLQPDQIAGMETLRAAEATALYGSRGANGVIIITTKDGLKQQNALLAQVKARTNLKETAFFFPQLKTNKEGEVSFSFESPESLTRWKLQLLAHNKQLASALMKKTVVTQKELMLLPNAPRFLREGDEITFTAKIASLSLDSLQGFARLELFNAITEEPVQSVIQSPVGNPNFVIAPKGNTEVSWQLKIPDGLEAVRYRIVAVAGDFSDGEENVLPVLSKRMLVQETLPLWVNAKTSKSFRLEKLADYQSGTLKHHRLSLSITTNPVWEAIRSLPYLMEYPYECSEQTFARYYANSLGSHIIEQQPAIREVFEQWRASGSLASKLEQDQELKALLIEETPWLREAKSESEQQKRLATLFEAEQLSAGLESSLKKLGDLQLSNGGLPWFSGSDRPNRYITQHIVSGLQHLARLTSADDFTNITYNGMAYMGREIVKDHKKLQSLANFDPDEQHIGFIQVQYLYAHSLANEVNVSNDLKQAMAFYKKQAYQYWPEMSLQSRAMIALFAHRNGDRKQAKAIMRSLKEYALESEELGNYWKSNVSGWYNWQAPIETQALMIEAFTEITKDERFVNGLRQWLLNHKRVNSWPSTKATTEAIYSLLSTGTDWIAPNNAVSVSVGAEQILKPGGNESGQEAGTGHLEKIWQGESVERELANVVIENKGKTQVWGGLFWQYFEDLDKITASMGPLKVEKQLYLVKQSNTGEELQAINESNRLKVGDLVRVRMILKTDRKMEFIHLKDMRASGFEPVNVLSGYRWREGLGYYESTRDAATNFFIESMPKGTYVFEYDLRANNEGTFSNGITSIQNMYAPEFSSHSEGIRITIQK